MRWGEYSMSYVFLDGSPVPPDAEVVRQVDSNKPMVFDGGRWNEVTYNGKDVGPARQSIPELRNGYYARGSEPPLDLLAGVRNGQWLDEQHFEPLQYAVPGVLPEGLSLLAGPPKIGKSWLGLSWSLACSSGGRALGYIEVGEPRPTLYLALEDGDRRLQNRCRRLLRGDPIPERFQYILRVEPHLVIPTLETWLDQHGNERPLVTLDTLGKVMPPALAGETTYGRDYRIGSKLHALCDEHAGASLLINHHDRKASASDFVASVSGTNGIAGACDTILVLVRQRHETSGVLKVTGRDVPEDEYALAFKDGVVWTLDGADLAAASAKADKDRVTTGLGDRSVEVAAFVLARPNGTRASEVAAALDLDKNTASTYLARLADAGRIVRASRGLYTPPVTSVRTVTTEDGDSLERNARNTHNGPTGTASAEDWTHDEIARMCIKCGTITHDIAPTGEPLHRGGCPR